MLLKNKTVIITGAGKGIGKVAANKFADQGAKVVVASRTKKEIDQVANEIAMRGHKAISIQTDISNPDSVQQMVERVIEEWGRIDVLINNAAMAGRPGNTTIPLWDMPLEDWDLVHGINMRGTMMCCKYSLPHMIEQGSGIIINVSSSAGRKGLEGRTHYCSSKSGIIGFTKALAWDAGKYGIRVNCVVPGSTLTELLVQWHERQASMERVSVEEVQRRSSIDSPENRMVPSEEVADIMVFLATENAKSLVGQSIDVGAGSWMS